MITGFESELVRVLLKKRSPNDDHILVSVEIEDDENWSESLSISSYWLDDLIDVLQKARDEIKSNAEPDIKDGKQWGYKFTS